MEEDTEGNPAFVPPKTARPVISRKIKKLSLAKKQTELPPGSAPAKTARPVIDRKIKKLLPAKEDIH